MEKYEDRTTTYSFVFGDNQPLHEALIAYNFYKVKSFRFGYFIVWKPSHVCTVAYEEAAELVKNNSKRTIIVFEPCMEIQVRGNSLWSTEELCLYQNFTRIDDCLDSKIPQKVKFINKRQQETR